MVMVGNARRSVYLVTATAAAAAYLIEVPSSTHSPSSTLPFTSAFHALLRSSRAFSTIALTALDYKFSLRGLESDSDDYLLKLSEVHLRSAERVLKLCEANKGFYVKAGQFVAALRQVPKEYSSTLSSLQDQAVPCHFKVVKEVISRNLGQDFSKMFLSLDENPMAAASIAQVHKGVLKDGQEVAVKVQYPGLQQMLKIDTTTMSFLSKSIAWFFPEYRFEWMVSEFIEDIVVELDFVQEARNSEKTANNFKRNKMVKVPHVFWDLTTDQVLTMEFCRGHKVDDLLYMKNNGIDPAKVAKVLVDVFAEMIFVHGFLHGDPHPGNILVCAESQKRFKLVLLDHGIYRQLDEQFRLNYCELWKALIVLDSIKIQHLGEQFGVGKYSRYFPVIFTGRTMDSKLSLGKGMSAEEKDNLKKELKSLRMEDISSFMESLPPDFLRILRMDGLLRSIIRELGASQRVRLLAYVKYALRGLSLDLEHESHFSIIAVYSSLKTTLRYFQIRLTIEVLELLYRSTEIPKVLYAWYANIGGALRAILSLSRI